MTSIISASNLNHTFGKGALRKSVLSDVTLSLASGEVVILEGPSGSGKTTLLTLLGALRSVQSGSLSVFGYELNGAKKAGLRRTRSQIGYIFQHHNLLTCLSAWENVSTALRLHSHIAKRDYRSRAVALLEAVGLHDKIDAYPENLSGGQKQRVAIARALVSHPKLILADEPTSSLDKRSGRDVVEIMQRLAREEGATVLLVTHDSRILDIADRVLRMEDGQLQP
ncbi:ATP-binding cassette domain-containing protein [cf. Phormidesmis sp. LEGE 11477]|uniref:ATP-binding cassette domain-containing protein n=1 Tax=cf. Phormidesmis sp. LEGE 11477 TaxID=1828680 RepID=UPI001881A2A6|nr:ATP-binding cassette domain-containing protein [cf. Phormidesmis sp. LEGE 11477]MBE9063513.1 ATP-binding cassette domain-containing protein [cf. Phormidesmis sp. LEGE 11477]